jgi:dihydroxyacetone kinase-like protein
MTTPNLTLDTFKQMLRHALAGIREREPEFSRLDAVLGDGDHGTAIVVALNAAVESSGKGADFKTMLNDMGFNVMLQTSGSTSTLLGAFFLGMSDAVPAAATTLDAVGVRALFAGGLKNVRTQTKAKAGDKTMMDALIPAVEAIEKSGDNATATIADMLDAAAQAARAGAGQTVGMKAAFGRARNYGDRSVGTADPGATSWTCMLTAFAEKYREAIK